MLIGVELTTANVGELFADAKALESAGADSLWSAGGDDPFVLLAALAAVTYRVRLVALDGKGGEGARATLERLSRGPLGHQARFRLRSDSRPYTGLPIAGSAFVR